MNRHQIRYREDLELIEAVRSGDMRAFRKIVEKYEHLVARTVMGMMGNQPDADDVGQEVFIRFYRSIDQFKGDSSLGTYLTRIGINLSLNELKRRKRRGWTSLDDDKVSEKPVPDAARIMEVREMIGTGLSALEPDFRSVLVLRLIQGYSTKETAGILDIPAGTVLSRLARAQEKLRKVLETME